jgi:type IV secretion system protein VirD4
MSVDKWEKNGGVYLGWEVGKMPQPQEVTLEPFNFLAGQWPMGQGAHEYVLDRHLVMFGPNGSGKSWRVLVPNLCRLVDWSMVVVDPKGALAAHTAVHRAKLDENGNPTRKVIIIDPFKVVEKNYPRLVERYPFLRSARINPIAEMEIDAPDGEAVDEAKAMSEAIIKVAATDNNPHFAQSAQALVRGLILALKVLEKMRTDEFEYDSFIKKGRNGAPDTEVPLIFKLPGLKSGATLGHVRQIIGAEPKALSGFIKWICHIPKMIEDYPFITEALNRFSEIGPENRELFSVLSTAITQTEWLASPQVRKDVAEGSFSFGRLKQEPVTVYLVLPPRYLATHAIWLRLMITTILLPLLRSVEDSPVPVLFMLDEYAALGHMEVIENNMALMREFGVKLFLALQDLGQLGDVHPKRWESFIGNAGVRLLFAPQEGKTQEYFSKLSGNAVWTYESSSSSSSWAPGQVSGGSNTGQSKSLVPHFAPEHLGCMERGQGVLFISETRSGRANVMSHTVLPDPRPAKKGGPLPYRQGGDAADQAWNVAVRVVDEARQWIG